MIAREVTLLCSSPEGLRKLWYEEYKPAISEQEGYIQAFLLAPQGTENLFQMLLIFKSEELATNWRKSNRHSLLSPKLSSVASVKNVDVFEIIED